MGAFSSRYPVRIIPCTGIMQVRAAAHPGEKVGDPGWLDLCHYRRSPESRDEGDYHRIGGGLRLRADRLDQLIAFLIELRGEAETRGVWPRGGKR